jgi:uncharacterized protein YjbI with pentapeptide repeats
MSAELEAPVRPYKGRHPFGDTNNDAHLFFGRDEEGRNLVNVVAAEQLSVLYARSGLGKTSLINARLMKDLRAAGYFPAAVRLSQDPDGDPLASLYRGLESEATRQGVVIKGGRRDSLWQYFSESAFSRAGKRLRVALILDQFEELFTIVRERWPRRFDTFVEQLADLVRGRMPEALRASTLARLEKMGEQDDGHQALSEFLYRDPSVDVKVLLSFREDFLPEMEALQTRIPAIFRNVVRLRPLYRANAEKAITGPAAQEEILGKANTFTFEPEALKEMLDFLGTQLRGARTVQGEEIEPTHLQLLCDELDQRRRRKKNGDDRTITTADLGGTRGMRRTLQRYYRSVLRRFPVFRLGWNARRWRPSRTNAILFHNPRGAVRRLCQNGMISATGRRNIVMADEIKRRYGLDDKALALLVSERLLRCEPRLGSEFYELSHDSLIAPLLSARLRRRMVVGGLFALLVVVPYSVLLVQTLSRTVRRNEEAKQARVDVEQWFHQREADFATVAREESTRGQRESAFDELVARDGYYVNRRFVHLTYRGKQLNSKDFSEADLRGAEFDRTSMFQTKFAGANLTGASLVQTQLSQVKFDGAILDHANFREANLLQSTFVNARLDKTVFAEADFTGARLTGVDVSSADFTDAAWWLGAGWTADQRRDLETWWPHSKIAASDSYKDSVKGRNASLAAATSTSERVDRLNELAWYRAVRGADLKQALKEASQAVKLADGLGQAALMVLDTRGYIELQLGRDEDALADFLKISWDKLPEKEVAYRTGVALTRAKRPADAAHYFDLAKGYEPTHELLLIPLDPTSIATR